MKLGVFLALFGDLVVGVQDRRVVAPKKLPICGSEVSVSSRQRYMAIWRGKAMLRVRFLEWRSSMRILK